MKSFFVVLSLILAVPAFAQEEALPAAFLRQNASAPDSGVLMATPASGSHEAVLIDGGVVEVSTSPAIAITADMVANPISSVKAFYVAAKSGAWGLAAALLLFFLVGSLRMFGKKVHDFIPDDSIFDRPLWFIFDTKVGGWLMNWLTAVAGVLGTAAVAGMPVDADAWKTAILCSTGSTTLIELKDDLVEGWPKFTAWFKGWWAKIRAPKEAAVAAPVVPAVEPVKPADEPKTPVV